MASNATDPLSLILEKLNEIQETVTGLEARVRSLEKTKTGSKPKPPPNLVGALRGLDEDALPAKDKLAFATGYVTAKSGSPPDKLCLDLGLTDYKNGYDLGCKVVGKEVSPPPWDRMLRTS